MKSSDIEYASALLKQFSHFQALEQIFSDNRLIIDSRGLIGLAIKPAHPKAMPKEVQVAVVGEVRRRIAMLREELLDMGVVVDAAPVAGIAVE